jgi:hypothetical protein
VKRVLLVLVLGAALGGCWRRVTLVPADAPPEDAAFVPDSAIDAATVAPVDASIDALPDASVDSSIDAL